MAACMVDEVDGCLDLQAEKGSVGSKGIVSVLDRVRNVGGGIEIIGCSVPGKGFT